MKKLCFVIAIMLLSVNVYAGYWSSYDYGKGNFTTGQDTTYGTRNYSTTTGTSYDYGTNSFKSYSINRTGNSTSCTTYDYGTGDYTTTNYYDY